MNSGVDIVTLGMATAYINKVADKLSEEKAEGKPEASNRGRLQRKL